MRLDPRGPGPEKTAVGYLNYRVGRTEEALGIWELARAESANAIIARIGLAGVYESRGRHAEARTVVQEMLRVNPDLTAELALGIPMMRFVFDPETSSQFLDQLRNAGLP